MKEALLIIVGVLGIVVACSESSDKLESIEPKEICIHGVTYYETATIGHGVIGSSLAPKYRPMQPYPVTCK